MERAEGCAGKVQRSNRHGRWSPSQRRLGRCVAVPPRRYSTAFGDGALHPTAPRCSLLRPHWAPRNLARRTWPLARLPRQRRRHVLRRARHPSTQGDSWRRACHRLERAPGGVLIISEPLRQNRGRPRWRSQLHTCRPAPFAHRRSPRWRPAVHRARLSAQVPRQTHTWRRSWRGMPPGPPRRRSPASSDWAARSPAQRTWPLARQPRRHRGHVLCRARRPGK